MLTRSGSALALALAFAFAMMSMVFAPSSARACGGTMCSTGRGQPPVDQAGEDIVYVVGEHELTMVVRIVYTGDPDEFAWVLPLPVAPASIDLGPESMFTQLAAATGPSFSIGSRIEGSCHPPPECDFGSAGCGCVFDGGGASASRGIPFSDAGAAFALDGGGVEVLSRQAVGAFETVVLSSGSATELHTWLASHGYDLPPSAIPILDDYVAGGHVFVAMRLRGGAGLDAIQPVMIHMATEQACLPIRLTAIATVPNLPIRAYFLAASPVVPTNYSLLDPPYSVNVFTAPSTWPQRWSDAIDDAGGHAWVRDYAGDPVPVSLLLTLLDTVRDATPQELFRTALGFAWPIEALVAVTPRFVELPGTTDVGTWVRACANGTTGCVEPLAWDPDGLVNALHAEVAEPRERLDLAFTTMPWLTRLYSSTPKR